MNRISVAYVIRHAFIDEAPPLPLVPCRFHNRHILLFVLGAEGPGTVCAALSRFIHVLGEGAGNESCSRVPKVAEEVLPAVGDFR